ncbi:MAG: hypothetical protein P4M12_03115 [Gammaproteobacteria bacterium]|nr:hypothetical protein [Gammaproteobacteria bacterium]
MKNLALRLVVLAGSCLALNACQSYLDQGFDKPAACREMKYQMIMRAPATSDPSSPNSWKERGTRGKLSETYHETGCI